MNWKSLLVLVILAGAAAFGVYNYRLQQGQSTAAADAASGEAKPLFPAVADNINDIDTLRVTVAGGEAVAELKRTDGGWVLANKGDYPASMQSVRKTLLALSNAEVVEEKTSNPENYSRLSVADVDQQDGAGTQVDLEGGLDQPLAIIIGDAASNGGTYVRPADQAQSYLVSETITPAASVADWVEQPIVELSGDRFQRVVIKHEDGELLTVAKQSRTDNAFKPFQVLSDRELSHETVANAIGEALSGLRLEDVMPAAEMKPQEQAGPSAEFFAFDGLKVMAKAFTKDDKYYVQLSAAFDAEQAEQFAPKAEEPKDSADQGGEDSEPAMSAEGSDADAETGAETAVADGNNESSEGSETAAEAPAEDAEVAVATDAVAAEAEELDQRLTGWVYEISQFKYENFSKKLEDLLKPVEEKSEDAPEQPSSTEQ